jgi:hypothetical protein
MFGMFMFEFVERLADAETRFNLQGGRCALCGKEIVFENYETGSGVLGIYIILTVIATTMT